MITGKPTRNSAEDCPGRISLTNADSIEISVSFLKNLAWLIAPRQSAIALIASLALLVVLSRAKSSFGLNSLERCRGFIAVFAMFTGLVLLAESIYPIFRFFQKALRNKAERKQREEFLSTLSAKEKGILLIYLVGAINTQYLYANDGNVGLLVVKGIIYRLSQTEQMTHRGPSFAYNLEPWAKEYIIEHPEVLDGAQVPADPQSPLDRKSDL